MTTPTPAGASPVTVVPTTFDYVGGNLELDQLLTMEQDLYEQQKAIAERLGEVKDRIKIALTSVTREPGTPFTAYRIAVPGLVSRTLKWKTSRRIDTPVLRRLYPEVYKQCSKESGAWFLERVK